MKLETPSITRISKRKPQVPLPKPFELPLNFPQHVEQALSSKALHGKARTKFITIIAQSIFHIKSYPTTEELQHVVQQMYKQWPFLNDGKDLVSVFKC